MANEDLAKLPKWAQEKIAVLERERKTAIDALNEALDSQTESPFYIDDWVSTGEKVGPSFKTRYVQAYKMCVKWMGVVLTILPCKNDGQRRDGIEIKWEAIGHRDVCQGIGAVPTAFNTICIPAQSALAAGKES